MKNEHGFTVTKGVWALIPFWLFVLQGCMNLKQPSTHIDYYTLEYMPPEVSDLNPLSAVVRVERFTVSPAYNTHRMIYRDRSFVRNGYAYRHWRANPADLVTYFLARDMRQSGRFQAILPYDSRLPSTYVLEGTVDEFFERDDETTWKAVLSIGITLMPDNEPDVSRKILFQKTYNTEEPCKKKNPQALAEAMSLAMKRLSKAMTEDVYSHLSKNR